MDPLKRITLLLLVGAAACAHIPLNPRLPALTLRASRQIALPGQPITLTAELVGDAVEAVYCPVVVWSWPDGTESGQEGDCPPWAPGAEGERRWTQHGALAAPGVYVFGVRLEKPRGHVVMRARIELTAAGGE